MEQLDRIERKLRKLRGWCEILVGESKENHQQYLFQEAYDLVINQIDFNLADIDEFRIDYAHGVDISPRLKKLKWEFNFVTRFYRDLCSLYRDPYRPRRVRRRPLRPRQWTFSTKICFFLVWMIDAMYATKKDLVVVNHYLKWPTTDIKNWWFP